MNPSAGPVRLTTLGTLDLCSATGARIHSVLAQPKRTALLLYLAMVRPQAMVQRETLMTLFWGERDTEQARHALRQSLYYLRTSLGAEIFATHGDAAVGIDRTRLWCDAAELERAAQENRDEDALALYAGELLPGFHVDDAPDFAAWLENEREWLRLRALHAAVRASEARERRGETAAAIEFARRAVEIAPAEEGPARRLMELHASAGDRVSALRAFQALKERLWRDYELRPSPETRALAGRSEGVEDTAASVSAVPEVQAGALPATPGGEVPASSPASASAAPAATEPTGGHRKATVLLAILLMAGAVAGLLFRTERGAVSHRLAVLPFDAGASGASASFAAGVHADLERQLTRIPGVRVVSHGPARPSGEGPYSRIAERLGVAHVVTGAVEIERAHVRIRAQLISARNDEYVWAEVYEDSLTVDNIFAIQARIAASIARALEVRLSRADAARIGAAPTGAVEALDHYYRGRDLFASNRTIDGVAQSAAALERAVEIDPDYALAWAALSTARAWLMRFSVLDDTVPAYAALQRARRLSSGAEVELATAYYAYNAKGDFAEALRSARRAQRLGLDDNAELRTAVALYLRRLGRWDEALEEHDAAMDLDARNMLTIMSYAQTLAALHHWDEANRVFRRIEVLAPESGAGQTGQLQIALRAWADTARGRRIVAALSRDVAALAAANARFELALATRDLTAAVAAAQEGVRLTRGRAAATVTLSNTSRWHPQLSLAIALHLAGRRAEARAAADTLRRIAMAQLARLRADAKVDPLGRRAIPLAHHAIALALLGDRQGAIRDAVAATALYNERVDAVDGVKTRELGALAFAIAGEDDRAVTELERLVSARSSYVAANLSMNPVFARLERAPRYRALVTRRERGHD